MKTYMAKAGEVERKWYLFDAQNMVLGRMAARIALILQGKHKPIYTPHVDTGDFVVVVNAAKVQLTGTKVHKRVIRWHSGFIGGLKTVPLRRFMQQKPEEVIRLAVRRMLPKSKLGRKMFKKLKVYPGPEHPHKAQGPVPMES
jgi:large subunit ribosomal protein L13